MRSVKRIAGILAAVLLSASGSHGQDLNVLLMESTFRIAGTAREADKASIGTAFLIHRPSKRAPEQGAFVLVTAAHVLSDIIGDEAVLLLRSRTADGAFAPFEHRVPIRNRGVPLWVEPAGVDVAVMYVAVPKEAHVARLSADLLANDRVFVQHDIHPGDELFSLGYPFGLPANSAGFPILRSGTIASYPLVPARSYPAFLYDFQVFEGNSGSPVYFTASSRMTAGGRREGMVHFIAGIVSRHAKIDGQRLQLASVVHAQFIREAIDSLPEPADPK
ncbi:MAG: trypsin-like peptidase domain-containing protein [Nitrospirota bacterium]